MSTQQQAMTQSKKIPTDFAITSRVGRKPIKIPAGVSVKLNGSTLEIKGTKGQMHCELHPFMAVSIEGDLITLIPNAKRGHTRKGSGKRLLNSIPGTERARIHNAIIGVSKGFERKLILVGVGYRAQVKGKVLNLTLGYSHPIDYTPPEGIIIEAPNLTEVIVRGIDKHLVGHAASIIRDFRGPEPYKGKGIRYANENIVRKETKKK